MVGLLFWAFVIGIIYTYAGYPLALALLARRREKPNYAPATPRVTLLISAYNEEAVIADKIENSLALEYPRDHLQILVAADGSEDCTVLQVTKYTNRGVELSFSPVRRGKTGAISRALPLANGEIVVFSDANNLYERNALRELVAPFADPTVGVVSGAKVIERGDGVLGESEGLYWKYESFIKDQETRLGCTTGVSGEILAMRRAFLQPPPDHIINDDFYMAMRMVRRGYRVVYVPAARSHERVSASAQDEITRRARIVAGRYQAIALASELLPWAQPRIVWQVVSHKFFRPLVPLAMLGALLANLIAVARPRREGNALVHLGPPWGWILLGLQAVFYGLAITGNRMERTGSEKLPPFIYLPTFLVNSNLAAVTGLYRFLTGRQSTRWQRVQRRGQTPEGPNHGD